jgi:ABC-type lipoprotein export system ATPase subunit
VLVAEDVGYQLPDGRELFQNINLRLAPGDAVAIEGPSGTGKSTLLALLGGLVAPTAGRIYHEGSDASASFAWVLQTLNSLAARTVLANVELLARLDGDPEHAIGVRAKELAVQLGLERALPTRARRLSGGELQRVAVARALVSTRPVILADEPTSQLDRVNASRVMEMLMQAASAQRRIVVVVTHDHDCLPPGSRVFALTQGGLDHRGMT